MQLEKARELAKNYFLHHNIECDEELVLESKIGDKVFVFWNTTNPNYYCKIEVVENKIYLDLYDHVTCSWIENI